MEYPSVVQGNFVERLNRFTALVTVGGRTETVHVKNTGRCRELLCPGRRVFLNRVGRLGRKTDYDLIGVEKSGLGLVNIDSQAPNVVVREWLETRGCGVLRPEYTIGSSRLDFYLEKNGHKILMEVKGCTLEVNGVGYFPDAPTQRGTKHLRELTAARAAGYEGCIAFVIQMEGVQEVRPNTATDPAFAAALEEALRAGVRLLFFCCRVTECGLWIERVISAGERPIAAFHKILPNA